MIWKVPEAHGDRVIRIKTEGGGIPFSLLRCSVRTYQHRNSPGADIDKNVWGGGGKIK